MRILIVYLLLLASTNLVFADVDCSIYKNQINDFSEEIKNVKYFLDKARTDFNSCSDVNTVVNSDEYKKAKVLVKSIITNTNVGANWSDVSAIK